MRTDLDYDFQTLRQELENVSALEIPDLAHEMACVANELPMYIEETTALTDRKTHPGRLMAWCFETGRRYGLLEALARVDVTARALAEVLTTELITARDRTLDLSLPDPEDTPAVTATINDANAPPLSAQEILAYDLLGGTRKRLRRLHRVQ